MSYFQKRGLSRFDQQFLAGGSFSNWVTLLHENGGVDMRYFVRWLYISAVALVSYPFRLYEKAKYDVAITKTEITSPPVFVLGHWRSGTTYVHQLMAQNTDFTSITFLHTMIPDLYLTGSIFKTVLRASLPEKRPMDNVKIDINSVEEEEYALGNLSPYSFYHALSFPRQMRSIFDHYVLFESVPPAVTERWKSSYMYFLKKVTFSSGGKRLLLKNPANTARIRVLLEMFPDAKFVHIYRNPYVVYSSTMNWLDKELVLTALQDVDENVIREQALINYEKMMHRYLEDRHLIPEKNLIELKFEDIEVNTLTEMERIYNHLDIPLTSQTRKKMTTLISSMTGYRKNRYRLCPETRQIVADRWGFVAQLCNYAPPQ
ncbi:MAG: sulfotransferase [Anaerolineae bacterium]|nr:sulfotransferase [Anaerolineae bacterium]